MFALPGKESDYQNTGMTYATEEERASKSHTDSQVFAVMC